MLIVRQDRRGIMNFIQAESIEIDRGGKPEILANWIYDNPLGTYESADRCKAVLQELWSAYANGDKVFLMPEY